MSLSPYFLRGARLGRAVTGVSLLIQTSRACAVVLGQIDNFQDGVMENWGGYAPFVVASGGPAGATDQFLEVSANGGDGPGSKLIAYNRTQWLGNYVTAGVNLITVDLKDFASTTLSIRIAFKDAVGTSGAGYCSTTPFILAADGAWHHATFAVSTAAMTAIDSPAESFNSLIGTDGELAEFRILDSNSPALNGDTINANLGIDNITASSTGPVITSSTWNAASGNWEDGTKWLSGMQAYGSGQTATFPDPTGTAPASATVTLTSNELIGGLAFTAVSKGSYTLAASGGSTLTFNGSGSSIHLVSTAGNVTIAVPLILNSALTAMTDGATTLTIGSGFTGTGGLTKSGTGTLAIAAPASGAGISPLTLSTLNITAGTFTLGSALSHSDRTLLISSGLSVTGAQLDVGGNDAIFHGVSIAAVQPLLVSGYNNGRWNGSGPSIISSLAHADSSHLTALGLVSGLTTFDGQAVLTSDLLLKYTYYGDANLDGQVNGSDYSRIDSGYLSHATGWFNGDFNYDGTINGSDYTLIDNTFNRQKASLASVIATAEITSQVSTSAVPEPACLLTLLTGLGLLGRRNKT